MNKLIMECMKFVPGLVPVADAFTGTKWAPTLGGVSKSIDMRNFNRIAFLIFTGAGGTGTSTVTVQASSTSSPDTLSAVPFYRRKVYDGSTDVPGDKTATAATGFVTTAASNELYVVEIAVEALLASGYRYVNLKMVESVDSPVLGGVIAILSEGRYGEESVEATVLP